MTASLLPSSIPYKGIIELPKVNPELTQALLGNLTDADKQFLEDVQQKAQERHTIAAQAAAKAAQQPTQ